jgi:hypothetical protein
MRRRVRRPRCFVRARRCCSPRVSATFQNDAYGGCNLQVIVERKTLVVIRVYTDFAQEGRRGKELHFDLSGGNGVAG